MSKIIDLTGQTYGYLTVINLHDRKSDGALVWHLKCVCGKDVYRVRAGFINGKFVSCGCKSGVFLVKHGDSIRKGGLKNKSEYTIYNLIKARCYNPKNKAYERYGGRGIKMCERWLDGYNNFLNDMGRRPSEDYSIDRIDNNGNYEPSNCRWATDIEQANNQRNNKLITYNGITKTLSQWCRDLKIPYPRTQYRIQKGWTTVQAFDCRKKVNQFI